jgi:hypothetical protein
VEMVLDRIPFRNVVEPSFVVICTVTSDGSRLLTSEDIHNGTDLLDVSPCERAVFTRICRCTFPLW